VPPLWMTPDGAANARVRDHSPRRPLTRLCPSLSAEQVPPLAARRDLQADGRVKGSPLPRCKVMPMMSMMLVPVHARFTFGHPLCFPRFASCTLRLRVSRSPEREGHAYSSVIISECVHSVCIDRRCVFADPVMGWARRAPGLGARWSSGRCARACGLHTEVFFHSRF